MLTEHPDMDWLLPAGLPTSALVGFELLLDSVVREVRATVVCAYNRSTFDQQALRALACVDPINVAPEAEPQFQISAADGRRGA